MLTFEALHVANKLRCQDSFHELDVWSPAEWSNAMAGESGEACNLTKKLSRIQLAMDGKLGGKWDIQTKKEIEDQLKLEIADVVIYADLLATRMGWDLQDLVRTKFNMVSEKVGSVYRLHE
jgi:hypothetical protein